jgi:hypothetical protein
MEKKTTEKKAVKKTVKKTVEKTAEKKVAVKKTTIKKTASKAVKEKKSPEVIAALQTAKSLVESVRTPQTPDFSIASAPSVAPMPQPGYWQDRYSETRIVLMIRDPYWCFSYWDLTAEKQAEVITQISGGQVKLILRVYDVTGVDFDGSNANRFMDIQINEEATNWYINVWAADHAYCVDLGLLHPDGQFVVIARSNVVTTPRDAISSVIDEEWMVVDETFDRLYKAAGADEFGRTSEAMVKYMLKRVRADVTSGGLGSMSSASGRPVEKGPDDFWLVVNTELIVYGATEPDAKVTIQGKPLRLNSDGTFSVRYSLPDGKQIIPVKAISSSGVHERQITPIVEKRTE